MSLLKPFTRVLTDIFCHFNDYTFVDNNTINCFLPAYSIKMALESVARVHVVRSIDL